MSIRINVANLSWLCMIKHNRRRNNESNSQSDQTNAYPVIFYSRQRLSGPL